MSLSLHSVWLTVLVAGLASPAAVPRTPVQRSLDDPTGLAMFEALITYDIETSVIAVKKAVNPDVRGLASSFEQGHRGC